jgi:hypothetical protein
LSRLIAARELARMVSNHLTPSQRASAALLGLPVFAAGHGFGLGVAVVIDPQRAQTHNLVDLAQLAEGIGLGVYTAITAFQALAVQPMSSRNLMRADAQGQSSRDTMSAGDKTGTGDPT